MFLNIVLLIVGMALLIKGADFFVDGASNIAKALKIPSLIIGLTLVSLGTSMPEASVSINSAISNMNDMSVGNVVGSNIFNTLLILGFSAIFVPLVIDSDMKKFDIPIMILFSGLLILFSFIITPLILDRLEAITMLVLFVGYMIFLIMRAKKAKPTLKEKEEDNKEEKKKPIWLSILLVVFGVAGIIFGGNIVVNNASKIAIRLGMSEILVGLTIVAVGTSLPELVTSIVAAFKKENDIAVGNAVGSNIFNIVFILGTSATISPLIISSEAIYDMLVMTAAGIILMLIALFSKKMNKWQGVAMFLCYVAYLTYIIIRN